MLVENEIFVSYTIREKGCDYIAITKANLNFDFLSFKIFLLETHPQMNSKKNVQPFN